MKYSISINQLVLFKFNLDVIDAAILDYLIYICHSLNAKVKNNRIGDWTWINLSKLASDMPMLKIKSISSISVRLDKLATAGFIKKMRDRHMKLYVKLTSKIDSLFVKTNRV
jgi:hypothetical protein